MKNIKAIVHRKGCGRKSGPQGLKKDLPVVHLHATQGNPDSIPARAGIGLRAPHYQDILTLLPGIGWIEVHSENYFGPGGAPLFYLQQVRKHYPLSLHGVGLSLGSTDALNIRHLEKLKGLINRFEPGLGSRGSYRDRGGDRLYPGISGCGSGGKLHTLFARSG